MTAEEAAQEQAHILITLALNGHGTEAIDATQTMEDPELVALALLGYFQTAWRWLAAIGGDDPARFWTKFREEDISGALG